jgi:hypothetical protein
MSTNARIGIERGDGQIESIYTHWDGYPEHHGPILLEHYKHPNQIEKLIDLGNLSILNRLPGQRHPFDARYEDGDPRQEWCVAYGRDRGEDDVAPVTHEPDAWPDYGQAWEYCYLACGEWVCRYVYADITEWRNLATVVAELTCPTCGLADETGDCKHEGTEYAVPVAPGGALVLALCPFCGDRHDGPCVTP